jgi:NitT/TauT family transport system permease protein
VDRVAQGVRPAVAADGFKELGDLIADGTVVRGVGTTMRRPPSASPGARDRRADRRRRGVVEDRPSAVGSLITGLQTMPSIAWFPLAILLFKLSEGAITFVVVLGAAPSIANGLITGVDHVPPLLVKAGRHDGGPRGRPAPPRRAAGRDAVVRRRAQAGLGVRLAQPAGRRAARHVRRRVVGSQLDVYREQCRLAGLMAIMIVILVVGSSSTRRVRHARPLWSAATPLAWPVSDGRIDRARSVVSRTRR